MNSSVEYEVINPMSDEEDRLDAIRQSIAEESIRPLCLGCDRPLTWIDEMNPRCACGMPLFFPEPESERI